MTRTLHDAPALVIAAFGTSTKAEATYGVFEKQLREALPGLEVRWAFTSEIIRERVNQRRRAEGRTDLLESLPQALANLQAQGFTKVVVQPLHIFPGEEYEEVLSIVAQFPGLHLEVGETLLQRWESLRRVVSIVSSDFLPPDQGCNVLVSHGTPSTNLGSNITYLGLERHVARTYTNVVLGAVEGIITPEDALGPARACPGPRVRFVSLMYVAGDHLMNDVMGSGDSWKTAVEKAGKQADAATVEYEGETRYKGLGYYPQVNEIFIDSIRRALARF
jgi:sirohydrochlorin cobaltochelatase